MGALWRIKIYRQTPFSASHLLSPLWIEAHLDGKAETHILHKVSLTYILNEATPGCTSWRNYRVGSWLCGCKQLNRERADHASNYWLNCQGNKAIRGLFLTCVISYNSTYTNYVRVWALSLPGYMTQTASGTIALWKGRRSCRKTCSVAHLSFPVYRCDPAFQRKCCQIWTWPLPFMSSVIRVDSRSEKCWLMFLFLLT